MSSEDLIGDSVQNNEQLQDLLVKNASCEEEVDKQSWQKKEKQLQNKVAEYETALAQEKQKVALIQKDLQERTEERDNFKKQIAQLEKDLAQKSLKGTKSENKNSDDMVTKAGGIIFEKTKVCKNQELQIEALTQQVSSLKEIVSITKDMLEIRNMEVKQLQDKLDCMDLKFTAEKDRHALMHAKLDRMVKLNADLKSEYEKQLQLFTELQKAYKSRQNATEAAQQATNPDSV